MRLRPGSVPWLLRHELRLTLRRYRMASRQWSVGVVVAVVCVLAQLVGLGLAAQLPTYFPTLADQVAVCNAVLVAAAGLMLSQALDVAMAALFERHDLEWLLASPTPLHRVLVVRMLGIAATVATPWLLLLGATANALAVVDGPGWLATYPVAGSLALLAAAAGTALAVGLVSWVGLVRARRAVGILGLAIGGLSFLASQSSALLTRAQRDAFWHALTPPGCGAPDCPAPDGVAWWPALAVRGTPGPLAGVVVLALGVAAAAAWVLARRFAAGAALDPPQRAAADGGLGAAQGSRAPVRFQRGPFRALLQKELRLIRRTPVLIGQVAFQLVYTLPGAVGLLRDGGRETALALGTISIFVAGEATRLLISATAGADGAPDLAGSAPVRSGAVPAAKLASASLGTLAVMVLPVAAVGASFPAALPGLAGGIACVTVCGLFLGLWRPVLSRRGDLGGRAPGLGVNGLLSLLTSASWTGATWLAMSGSAWAAAPAGVALTVLAAARPRRRS